MVNTAHSILFVDDEENILNSLFRLFHSGGYKIFLAKSAKEGLIILESEKIEAVVSDHTMSEMNGIQFLKIVKNKWPDTTRLMLTAFGFTEFAHAAIYECDVYRFITKPWKDKDAKEAIRQALLIHRLKINHKLRDAKEELSYTFQKTEKLKDALIAEKLLTGYQINQALAVRKSSKESLAGILIKLHFITEEKLLDFLGRHLKIPFARLSDYEIDPAAVTLIPEKFARRYKMIPISKKGDKISIAMSDPADIITLSDIQALIGSKGNIQPVLCSELELFQAIEKYYSILRKRDTEEIALDVSEEKNEDEVDELLDSQKKETEVKEVNLSVISRVNNIIAQAVKERASDIHIDMEKDKVRVRYRVDGILFDIKPQPKELYLPLVSRIKVLASLDISQKRIPQDGCIRAKVKGREIELRASTYPTINGESIVLRILDKASGLFEIADLGLSLDDRESFEKIIHQSYGMLLVAGPTGSGKTTTLYSAIRSLDAKAKNIITIEEPVEYEINDISQGEIQPRRGLNFANALRAILRHDPDVILVGEIRDSETAQIAFRAAMTGHLVFSTLHTNNAIGALSRLFDLGVEPFVIGSSLTGVLSQRLVRKICSNCKVEFKPDTHLINELGLSDTSSEYKLYKGKGCNGCKDTGYKGRIGIFEFFIINKEISDMIMHHIPESEIEKAALASGMKTLKMDGVKKVLQGTTTLEEVNRVA